MRGGTSRSRSRGRNSDASWVRLCSLQSEHGPELSDHDIRMLAVELARENELLNARVVEITELAEEAVAGRVEAERAREEAEQEFHALLQTRAMRMLRPLRSAYGRLRRRFGRVGL